MFLYLKSLFYFLFKQPSYYSNYRHSYSYFYSYFKARQEAKRFTKNYTKEYYDTYLKLNDDYIPKFKDDFGYTIDELKRNHK